MTATKKVQQNKAEWHQTDSFYFLAISARFILMI